MKKRGYAMNTWNNKFESNDTKLNFTDVFIVPQASSLNSRKSVKIETTYTLSNSNVQWSGVPIIASNMDYIGTLEMSFALQNFHIGTAVSKFTTTLEWEDYISKGLNLDYAFPTFGLDNKQYVLDYLSAIYESSGLMPKIIVLDVPNGYINKFSELISDLRDSLPDTGIIAGNVVTPEGVELLAQSGADGVKLGIGSGSVCTTSMETGVGYPQLSAILDCAQAALIHSTLLISDGGISSTGDIAKAFIAGAHFIMIGGILAGHDEGGAPIISKEGVDYRLYYGMSSEQAMNTHYEGIAEYRTTEGVSKLVKNKGPITSTIKQLLGGLRSSCTYVNAENVDQLPTKGKFIKRLPY